MYGTSSFYQIFSVLFNEMTFPPVLVLSISDEDQQAVDAQIDLGILFSILLVSMFFFSASTLITELSEYFGYSEWQSYKINLSVNGWREFLTIY